MASSKEYLEFILLELYFIFNLTIGSIFVPSSVKGVFSTTYRNSRYN